MKLGMKRTAFKYLIKIIAITRVIRYGFVINKPALINETRLGTNEDQI